HICDDAARATFRLHARETAQLSLSYAEDAPAVLSCLGETAKERIRTSLQWWKQWAARASYEGPYREVVIRSALTLKLLTYAPSGAVIAAATTSLPERVGGDLNWDYRYCWLRDASLTVRALIGLQHHTHARLMWWTALDRLHKLASGGVLEHVPLQMFAEAREAIRYDIRNHAWNPGLRSYASVLGGSDLDASLLLLTWYGFE